MSKLISDCPFCYPLVLKACFAESNNFRAIYNIAPILPGHSLIAPKNHYQSFLELPDAYLTELILFSKDIAQFLNKTFNTTSFDLTIQDGVPAGQSIPHLHIHIIPRHAGDLSTPGDWYPRLIESTQENIDSDNRPKLNSEELQSIVSHLKELKLLI